MRLVLAAAVLAALLPTTASSMPVARPLHHFRRAPIPAPAPTPPPTTKAAPLWTVVDATGKTMGVATALGRDGVATVLLAVGTESVAVNVSASGWTVEGGGPLYYAATDCAGDPYTPRHLAPSLTAHAFGAYLPEEGLNDTTLYIADASATPQDVVVYSMRSRTTDDSCTNMGGSAPTTLYPVRVYSSALAGYTLPFVVKVAK
jgi:hypothetical protein